MKNNLWCGRIVHRKTHCTQILRIMRLTVFFLLFIVFETYSLNVRSQNQKVTMNKGTATLSDIIRQIEKTHAAKEELVPGCGISDRTAFFRRAAPGSLRYCSA